MQELTRLLVHTVVPDRVFWTDPYTKKGQNRILIIKKIGSGTGLTLLIPFFCCNFFPKYQYQVQSYFYYVSGIWIRFFSRV